jgi:hypothetical protein
LPDCDKPLPPSYPPNAQRTAHKTQRTCTQSNNATTELRPYKERDSEYSSESGRSPYFLNSKVREDQAVRERLGITPKDYGTCWHAAYREMIGERPELGPGDVDGARLYHSRIVAAIEKGESDGCWTDSETCRLKRMELKWRRRAEGLDARFQILGNRNGGTPRERVGDIRVLDTLMRLGKIDSRIGAGRG